MKFENSFTVQAPIDEVYAVLLDVERVAPCMPGAEVLEKLGDDSYRIGVRVRLGPMSMMYRGQVEIVERDAAAHSATMQARAKETRGQGTADAKIFMHLEEESAGTKATMETDVQLSGRAASMGQGMIGEVSAKLVEEFAKNLAGLLQSSGAATPAAGDSNGAATSPGEPGAPTGGTSSSPPSSSESNGSPSESSLPIGKIAASVIGGRLSEPRTLAIATMSLVGISGAIGYALGRSK